MDALDLWGLPPGIYSNLTHHFVEGAAERAKANPGAKFQHSALDFCGYVSWDADQQVWVEEVWVHNACRETMMDGSLEILVLRVCEKYGSD